MVVYFIAVCYTIPTRYNGTYVKMDVCISQKSNFLDEITFILFSDLPLFPSHTLVLKSLISWPRKDESCLNSNAGKSLDPTTLERHRGAVSNSKSGSSMITKSTELPSLFQEAEDRQSSRKAIISSCGN